jgi:hypothetical protein
MHSLTGLGRPYHIHRRDVCCAPSGDEHEGTVGDEIIPRLCHAMNTRYPNLLNHPRLDVQDAPPPLTKRYQKWKIVLAILGPFLCHKYIPFRPEPKKKPRLNICTIRNAMR